VSRLRRSTCQPRREIRTQVLPLEESGSDPAARLAATLASFLGLALFVQRLLLESIRVGEKMRKGADVGP
jgi:hypothetical protein